MNFDKETLKAFTPDVIKAIAKDQKRTEKLIEGFKSSTTFTKLDAESKQTFLGILNSVLVERARYDFLTYVRIIAPLFIPGNVFIEGAHIEIICKDLQSVAESIEDPKRKTERSQYFMPPRAMKSLLISIFFPTWVYGRWPHFNIMQIGNSTKFAEDRFGRNVKALMHMPEYRSIFPETVLRADAKAAGRFVTTKGGEYFATGVGSQIAGRGAHITICDDVLSEQTAFSKTERENINQWYLAGLRSRLTPTPQGAEIIVNTRWHMEDLSAYLLEVDEGTDRPWNVISFPAILDKKGADLLNQLSHKYGVFKEGDSFWPQFQPLEGLLEKKQALLKTEPHKWHALYMQTPTGEEGNIIKYEEWKDWNQKDESGKLVPPYVHSVMVSMDTAFSTSDSADYSAITVWGVFYDNKSTPCMCLLHAEKGKWEFDQLCAKAREMYESPKWPTPDVFVVEKKASGQSLIQVMRSQLPVYEYLPDRDKRTRLYAASMFFKQGRIYAPFSYDWATMVREEVCNFPNARNDDLTDATSQAILWFKDNGEIFTDEDGYAWEDEEDDFDKYRRSSRKTYWSAMSGVE